MKMQESAQDYLESILILSQKQDYVRATDICAYFGYARATVSVFMKQLRENGYVSMDEHKHISLTEAGRQVAVEMYERHKFLSAFFESIGVPEKIAVRDACRMEHYISADTFKALKEHFGTSAEIEAGK